MKTALCFLISGKHILNKEKIWSDWIEPNKDIINVYIHYKDISKIQSEWIKQHVLPETYIVETDYYHVVNAYMTCIKYGLQHDVENEWFCFLSEACVPIVSPNQFRKMFLENQSYSFMSWKKSWWNMQLIRRANLHRLKPEFHLAHAPWFILNKKHAQKCMRYLKVNTDIYNLICAGRVANESIFAIILRAYGCLEEVKNVETTATDWSRMMSPTSPYLFTKGGSVDVQFIDGFLKAHPFTMFLRKVDPSFPDAVLLKYIYGS